MTWALRSPVIGGVILSLAWMPLPRALAEGWGPALEHCWWDGGGMRCPPNLNWNRERRREEWRERHEEYEEHERREWCDRHPAKCW